MCDSFKTVGAVEKFLDSFWQTGTIPRKNKSKDSKSAKLQKEKKNAKQREKRRLKRAQFQANLKPVFAHLGELAYPQPEEGPQFEDSSSQVKMSSKDFCDKENCLDSIPLPQSIICVQPPFVLPKKPTPLNLYIASRIEELLACGKSKDEIHKVCSLEYNKKMSEEQKKVWILLALEKEQTYQVILI